MKNCPGISWGLNKPINLFRSSIGWIAAYYDNEHSQPEIVRVFNPDNLADYYVMKKKVAWYNYHTDRLCPFVKMQNDGPTTIHDEEAYLEYIKNG